MSTIKPGIDIIFLRFSPTTFKHMFFLVSVLGTTTIHIPLKYRYMIRINHGVRHVYLVFSSMKLFLLKKNVTCDYVEGNHGLPHHYEIGCLALHFINE